MLWRTSPSAPPRRAAAAVEMAALVPFLGIVVTGSIEVTRAIQVKNYLTDAARSGCRLAVLPSGTNAGVTSNINQVLTDHGLSTTAATMTIQVNGKTVDVSTAKQGDQVSVKVGMPISQISWITLSIFTSQSVESETQVMLRQMNPN
jgi:Flp pilus assembly protein TadG